MKKKDWVNYEINVGKSQTATPTIETGPDLVHPFNRWCALFYNPSAPSNADTLYSSYSGAYADATEAVAAFDDADNPLCTKIAAGTSNDERVGTQISIMKDHHRFRFSLPQWETPVGGTRIYCNQRLNHRRINVRLLGIYQGGLEDAGDIGFTPAQLFEKPEQMRSPFNTNNARGYKIVYDKTKSLVPRMAENLAFNKGTTNDTGAVGRSEIYFGFNMRYKKTWVDGNDTGDNVPESISLTSPEGLRSGIITWYIFVEDKDAQVNIDSDDSLLNAAGTSHIPVSADPRMYCWTGIKLHLTRKLRWIDP